jgi:hypothetical protein
MLRGAQRRTKPYAAQGAGRGVVDDGLLSHYGALSTVRYSGKCSSNVFAAGARHGGYQHRNSRPRANYPKGVSAQSSLQSEQRYICLIFS